MIRGFSLRQERMKYGKMGWNINYDFNGIDFVSSVMALNTHATNWQNICWKNVKFVLGEVRSDETHKQSK